MSPVHKIRTTLTRALQDTIAHDGIEHAGYLAFLSLLSLFPFLVLMMAIAGYIGASDLGSMFTNELLAQKLVPDEVIATLTPRIQEITSGPPQNILTLAIIGALWTASSMVEGLRTILNRAFRVSAPPPYWWRRILSITQFLVLMSTMLLTLLILIVIPTLWIKAQTWLGLSWFTLPPLLESARLFTAMLLLFFYSAGLYYFVPNLTQRIRDILPGALTATLLWYWSGILLNRYIEHFEQVHLIYGSLAGIIATLLFFYLSAMIFIFGAEVNYHWKSIPHPQRKDQTARFGSNHRELSAKAKKRKGGRL